MTKDIATIEKTIRDLLTAHTPPLKVRHDLPEKMELAGTKERMQGKQKVDGYYFATVMPKPKDVRLYFFPIYTHADAFADIPADLRKFLKGKSCFHIKKMDEALEQAIKDMIEKGVELYEKDDLI